MPSPVDTSSREDDLDDRDIRFSGDLDEEVRNPVDRVEVGVRRYNLYACLEDETLLDTDVIEY